MNQFQAQKIINLVQETKIAEAFAELQTLGVSSTELTILRREYEMGMYRYDFYERLQVCINHLANTDFKVVVPKIDLFFSFSSKNQHEAEREVKALREAGLTVFFSGEDLQNEAGQDYSDKIQNALEHAQHFVLHCTAEAMKSPWVKKEYILFHNEVHMKDEKNRYFFILRGKGYQDKLVPFLLKNIQTCQTQDIIRILHKPQDALEELRKQKKQAEKEKERKAQIEAQKQAWREQERQVFAHAQELHTIQAYQTYLNAYPEGEYAKETRKQIQKIERKQNTPSAPKFEISPKTLQVLKSIGIGLLIGGLLWFIFLGGINMTLPTGKSKRNLPTDNTGKQEEKKVLPTDTTSKQEEKQFSIEKEEKMKDNTKKARKIVSNKIKKIIHYRLQIIETIAYYKYDEKDRLIEIKHYLPNTKIILKEELVFYNSLGFLSEYRNNVYYTDGKTYKWTWRVNKTDASGRPEFAIETIKNQDATTNTYTYTYTHNVNGQLINRKSNNHNMNYSYTYYSDGKLKAFGLDTFYNPIQYDTNGNVKRYGKSPPIFEYNNILAPNWFLFDGSALYVREGYMKENDKIMQRYLPIDDSAGQTWIYEYDEYKRPIKVKPHYWGKPLAIAQDIEYID